uniref:(northern house mosquito) hypothetical protein n=1 Tax=Culex pipiens TaxID=7175 RepID=A0A8D8L2Q9_CULPI
MPPMNQLSSGGIGGRDSFRGSGSAVGSRPLIYNNNNKITATDGAGAVRLLHDKEIDGKKLVAKVDAKTRSCSMTTRRRINWCLRWTGNEMFGDDKVLDLISRILDDLRVAATISVKAATAVVAEDVVNPEKRNGTYRHRRKHKSFETHALLQGVAQGQF